MEEPQISIPDQLAILKRLVEEQRFDLGEGEITGRFYCGRILKDGRSVGVVVLPVPVQGDFEQVELVVKAAVREAMQEVAKEPALRQ